MEHALVVLFKGNVTSWCRLCACVKRRIGFLFLLCILWRKAVSTQGLRGDLAGRMCVCVRALIAHSVVGIQRKDIKDI